jgi:hypothetical protein
MTSCESKLRSLAMLDTALVADLGPPTAFRWFDRSLPQGQLTQANACVSVQRLGTLPMYNMGGLTALTRPRLQINVFAYSGERARQIASDVDAFLAGVSLVESPRSGAPTLKLDQRSDVLAALEPLVYVEILDYRVWNREDLN